MVTVNHIMLNCFFFVFVFINLMNLKRISHYTTSITLYIKYALNTN